MGLPRGAYDLSFVLCTIASIPINIQYIVFLFIHAVYIREKINRHICIYILQNADIQLYNM